MQKILIVEDEDEIRLGLKYFFEASGFLSAEAMNGQEALRFVSEDLPDIIISDIMMPFMDGYELIRQLKQSSRTKDIPFFFLTAKTEAEEVNLGLELGANGYITKPFSVKELLNSINKYLK